MFIMKSSISTRGFKNSALELPPQTSKMNKIYASVLSLGFNLFLLVLHVLISATNLSKKNLKKEWYIGLMYNNYFILFYL